MLAGAVNKTVSASWGEADVNTQPVPPSEKGWEEHSRVIREPWPQGRPPWRDATAEGEGSEPRGPEEGQLV